MNDYIKGTLTGASLVLCFFMFISAKSQSKNLGDIAVKSIKVLNNKGQTSVLISSSVFGGSGMINIKDDGQTKASLGSENGNGVVVTYGENDKQSTVLGGFPVGVSVYNKKGDLAGMLAAVEGFGYATLYDRYGNSGWSASGKK